MVRFNVPNLGGLKIKPLLEALPSHTLFVASVVGPFGCPFPGQKHVFIRTGHFVTGLTTRSLRPCGLT